MDSQRKALELVPFMDEFNTELFQVKGLERGNYLLSIDNVTIGEFPFEALNDGINLADFNTTPQYKQAMAVRNVLTELWGLEADLRSIKFIEYNDDFKSCPLKKDITAIKSYLTPIFQKKETDYYLRQLEKYVVNKPLEASLIDQLDVLRKKAYALAQPKRLKFELKKL